MKLWDCIFYDGERDILEARIEHLDGVVHRHVVVEGTHTFTGKKRVVERPDHERVFSHVVKLDDEPGKLPWAREWFQRNECLTALRLAGATAGDMVLIADVDEFPTHEALAGDALAALTIQSLLYYLNGMQDHGVGLFPVLARFAEVERYGVTRLRDERFRIDALGGEFRNDAGRHFTYQGGAARIRRKLASFSHQELKIPEVIGPGQIEARMEAGLWLTQPMTDKRSIHYVPLESFAPPAILNLAKRRPEWVHE